MEYRLNKIDTDLRQKINDSTKEGQVHAAQNIAVNKDKKENKGKKDLKLQRYNKSKKLIVEAVKADNIEIEAFKENPDRGNETKGNYIDIKK